MRIPEVARDLLKGDGLATVVTLDPDGTPHVTAAWVGVDGEEVVIATMPDQRKLRNLRRDPRIAVTVHATTRNTAGLTEYLVLYGRARITEGGAPELLQELAHTYIGPHVKFPPMPNPPPGFVTHVTVDRIGGVGPWTSETL
jgi:PPOX class probable F420-dependent enzyme